MTVSANTETAILAGGCFWPAQELLRRRAGVISTCVGYTGGENDNPTADNHPGHAEAVKVVFDPERTSYRDILEFFLQIHRPDLGEEHVGSDYRSEIFCLSDEQRRVAEDTVTGLDTSGIWPGKIVTRISDASPFWAAEEEDQEYLHHFPETKNQLTA
jgi:peptide-methionine (S)-S-oxide reductase